MQPHSSRLVYCGFCEWQWGLIAAFPGHCRASLFLLMLMLLLNCEKEWASQGFRQEALVERVELLRCTRPQHGDSKSQSGSRVS